jgi:hypothetical protein
VRDRKRWFLLSPPTVQRETIESIDQIDHVDLVAPVHVPKDIVVGEKSVTPI